MRVGWIYIQTARGHFLPWSGDADVVSSDIEAKNRDSRPGVSNKVSMNRLALVLRWYRGTEERDSPADGYSGTVLQSGTERTE